MATQTGRPVAQLFGDVVNDLTGLAQTELRLFHAELSDKFSALASAGVVVGVGAILLIASLGVALLAVSEWLIVAGMTREWALTLVALAALIIGGILAARGVSRMKTTELVPERTVHQARETIQTFKDHVT